MTQDPYGPPPGSGYVVRGEVVPDDEANVTPPTTPMTHFQKVASALRGDRTDPAMPAVQEADPADPESPDPNGTWPDATQAVGPTRPDAPEAVRGGADSPEADQDADAAHPEEVGAVRSPDDESHDYWDEAEADRDETSASAVYAERACRRRRRLADAPGRAGSHDDSAGSLRHRRAPRYRRGCGRRDAPSWRLVPRSPVRPVLWRLARPGSTSALRRRRACGRANPTAGSVTSAT